RKGADAGEGAGLEAGALAAAKQVGIGFEQAQHLVEAACREVVAAADARTFFEVNSLLEILLGEQLVRHLQRLLEADGSSETTSADLQEDLIGDVVVRAEEQLRKDRRQGPRLTVNVDGLEARGHRSGRNLALETAARALDECGDQLAGILQAHLGI